MELINWRLRVPAGGGFPKSIPSSSACRGLGRGVGCGLVFRVASVFGCPAFAVLSFSLVVGSLGVGRAACAAVSYVQVVGPRLMLFAFVAHRVCIGRSARAVVSFHSPHGAAHRVGRPGRNSAEKCECRVVSVSCLNTAIVYQPRKAAGRPVGDMKGAKSRPISLAGHH